MDRSTDSLESMCELVIDCPHSTPKWTDKGKIVLRNNNIKGGVLDLADPSYTDEEHFQERVRRAVPQVGDIVFTREAPMGEVCMLSEGLECCLGQRQVLLRPRSDIDGRYLFWALQSPVVQHEISWNEGTGSTVSNVRIPVLKALKIPRHPGSETKISDILSSLADKIALNRQTNQTLEQIAQAIFKSWFVDFEPVKAKQHIRTLGGNDEQSERAARAVIAGAVNLDVITAATDLSALDRQLTQALGEKLAHQTEAQREQLAGTASHFPDQLEESELGLIPAGWGSVPFTNLARLDTSSVKPFDEPETVWEHYSIPAFDKGMRPSFDLGADIKSNKYRVDPNAVLCSKLNPQFPRTWYPEIEHEDMAICSTEFMQFVPLDPAHRAFILGVVTSRPFQTGILQRVTGSTGSRQRAQPKSVSAIGVINPGVDLIESYSIFAGPILKISARNILKSGLLAAIRDTFLSKLLSGELDLSGVG